MSLDACLGPLETDGKISADQAAQARELYDRLLEDYMRSGSRESAEALASAGVLEQLERSIDRKDFLAGRTIKTRQRIAGDLAAYNSGKGGKGTPIDPRAGPALLDHDPRAPFSNVEGRRKAILGTDGHRLQDRLLAEHSAGMTGKVRNLAQLKNVVRELFGENSGDAAAREIAESWRKVAEKLRQRFNAAGGEIGFRADWGLPQSHNWKAVRKAGFQAWRDFITPLLDREKMIDRETGRPFTDEALASQLEDTFNAIRSNDATRRTPGSPVGSKSLANTRGEERFLIFKSADAWDSYAGEFGSGTAYDAMMRHIDGMARDIAALEILGPNPPATLRWLKDTISHAAELDVSPGSDAVNRAGAAGKSIDELWDEYRGAHNDPRNEKLALVFSTIRALQTATKLGSATLSSTGDLAFQASRRRFNGLPVWKMIGDYAKLMRPGSLEDQKLAVRRGLIAEEWAHRTASQNRYLTEELTGETARRLAEGVLRLSLLSRHTQAARWVYGLETLATYTEHVGHSYEALPPRLREALGRYGLGAGDWEKLRSAPLEHDRGIDWIAPHRVADDELASRFMEMVHEETDLAVPVADLRTRAFLHSKLERGTVLGEVGRSAGLFKSFGVSVVLNQAREIMAMPPARGARYFAGMLIGTAIMGALGIQLKELASARDPRPMASPDFASAAILQGGGFGIFGDFLYSSEARTGNGFADTLAGPLVDDAWALRNIAANPRHNAVREVKGFIPGNNLWYARTAFDRLVADQLEQAIDPDYRKSWKRMDRYAYQLGTDYWWEPGASAPDRAPNLANATEGKAP